MCNHHNSCGCGKSSHTEHAHGHNHEHHSHTADNHGRGFLRLFLPEILTSVLLIISVIVPWANETWHVLAFIIALFPVGIPIVRATFKEWIHGDIFNEFTLMVIASIGAFLLKEYPEGVAVLLFYSMGEKLEDVVSGDVKGEIKKLLGKMPRYATVITDDNRERVNPKEVIPGSIIAVKPGESIPLDGVLLSENDEEFNTAAITGESIPRSYSEGDKVMSGIIPLNREVKVKVTHAWKDSSMSRIIKMIEDASAHRAPSESILRKITRWYTPVVFGAAILLCLVPWLVSLTVASFEYEWETWFRRALVFLVCSCPCALIVSIPLTYFASIGIASKKGILFKGHDSLDAIRNTEVMLFDKTGTITTGEFSIESIEAYNGHTPDELLTIAAAVERESSHPLALAIVKEASEHMSELPEVTDITTISHGIKAMYGGKKVLLGSDRLMKSENIPFGKYTPEATSILIAIDNVAAGIIKLTDTIKDGVKDTFKRLHKQGVSSIGILSGDSEAAVSKTAASVGADYYKAGLLPDDKQIMIKDQKLSGKIVAFVGDGVNDGPALATSDIGIAMGNLGTDIAIESARVVIAGDDLEKISEGIDISNKVKHVIIENVVFAFGVKLLVMTLGAFGIATLWAAVFADTGVTVITILWTLYRLKIWQLKKKM